MYSLFLQETGGSSGPSVYFPILFITLVLSTYILWRRYRSRRLLLDRISELEDLSVAGRAIAAAQLDIVALCQLIAHQAGSIVDTSSLQIGILDDGFYEILYWTVDGETKQTPQAFDLSDNPGLVGWVLDSKRSLLINDYEKEMASLPAQPSYVLEHPPRSAIFIPLVSGKEAIGLITAHSPQPAAFSQRDLGRLTILANQAAAAIANAQIYQQERTKAAQLELVGQIAQQVNAISDLDDLLTQVVKLSRDTFDFESVIIYGIDPGTGQAVIQAGSLASPEMATLKQAPVQGIVGAAIATRTTTVSNNTVEDPRFSITAWSANTCSEIAIPLIVEQELLGVLDVQSRFIGSFSVQEQSVLEALAAQVAIAIHKAHQFNRQRRQSWAATAQLQVAEMISRSADLESLTASIVRLIGLLFGVDSCVLLLWDEEFEEYQNAAEYGLNAETKTTFESTLLSLGDWPALDAVYIGQEVLPTNQSPPWLPESIEQESLLLPLIAKGRTLGVIVVTGRNDLDGVVSENRDELLRNSAAQTAQAIDSIRLQLAQQEEAWVNTALLQVAEAVNQLTDLNEILYTIVRMLPLLVGVRSCIILIWDETSKTFQAGPSHGLTEMGHGLLESFDVNLSEFPLLSKQDLERIGPDANYYTFQLPEWMGTIMDSPTANLFPLYARARLVGAMLVGPTRNSRPLVGRRMNIVSGIAQQAAIAVVNHQLYKESAQRNRMEQELDVARSIQASLIPGGQPEIPECTVYSFWEAARQVSGDFYDFLPLEDNKWGIAIADVADKGIPAALFMALSRTILRTVAFNRISPAKVLERTNEIIYNDTSSDLFVTVFYCVWDPQAARLTYASGGHNPPLLIRENGTTTLLKASGIALGVLEKITIEQKSVQLEPGDLVIFYTDGVTEAMNEDYDEYGLERLRRLSINMRTNTAEEIARAIRESIDDHAGGAPQFDDITLVVFKR